MTGDSPEDGWECAGVSIHAIGYMVNLDTPGTLLAYWTHPQK